jgi:hypothetical protein
LWRKTLLDDSTSGGLEAVPIEFDAAVMGEGGIRRVQRFLHWRQRAAQAAERVAICFFQNRKD